MYPAVTPAFHVMRGHIRINGVSPFDILSAPHPPTTLTQGVTHHNRMTLQICLHVRLNRNIFKSTEDDNGILYLL